MGSIPDIPSGPLDTAKSYFWVQGQEWYQNIIAKFRFKKKKKANLLK